MFKKILLLITILFLWTIPSTVKAEGIVPVICLMEKFNYCKDIDKIEVFDIKNNWVEVYNTKGYTVNNETKYSLTDIEAIED